MKRIFYFSGHRLTVFHWNGKALAGACSFEPNEEGYEKFRQYLESSAKTPTGMLLDVIEEDFRKGVIPHVHGKDRRAVISRLIDRYYRSSRQFTYSEIQGRQKTGRKDDEILLGAITNPDLVSPWINIIDESDVPLSGIWSLPLISKSLLPIINARKGPVLLVTQQVNSNLRQTFFKDGKMVSSRQSVINQDAENISKIGLHALPEVKRTLVFMRNQHQIGDDEIINVHILGADEQIDSLDSSFESDELHHYHIHRIRDISAKMGISGMEDKFSDGLFACIAANRFSASTHYGYKEEFIRFYYSLASTALYAFSVVIIIVALLMTETSISDGMSYKQSTALLKERSKEFKSVYEEKYEAYEELFSDANLMDSAVGLVEQIEKNSHITPMDFMVELSKIISQPQLGLVYIDKIEWTTRQLDRTKNTRKSRNKPGPEVAYKKTNPATDETIQHVAVVSGRIPVVSSNFRESVNHINNIITVLKENDRVEEVSAIDLPVEVRPERKFASESRAMNENDKNTADEQIGTFSLQIVMRSPGHA